jgi:hypothetical protein
MYRSLCAPLKTSRHKRNMSSLLVLISHTNNVYLCVITSPAITQPLTAIIQDRTLLLSRCARISIINHFVNVVDILHVLQNYSRRYSNIISAFSRYMTHTGQGQCKYETHIYDHNFLTGPCSGIRCQTSFM